MSVYSYSNCTRKIRSPLNDQTIVESTTHSLAIDVLVHPTANIGDLFVSDSKGTDFVISLRDTNRNERGTVDFENLVGLDGIGVANLVDNREEVVGWGKDKQLRSVITFNDGQPILSSSKSIALSPHL